MDIAPRHDGQWNVWTRHALEAASAWHVVHVARNRHAALMWIKKNGRNQKWYNYGG